jgi:hypothetical protein
MNTTVIHQVLAESQAGKLVFPEVVRRLMEVGVESYFCDLAQGEEIFYLADGETHREKMVLPPSPIAGEFRGRIWYQRFAERRQIRFDIRSL